MTTTPADGMPTTRGMNFYLADPNLAFVCASVMRPDDLARARPHLLAMGEVAGGELAALAAVADRNPPVLRPYDEAGRRVDWREGQSARKLLAGALYLKKWLRPPPPPASVFTARECDWLPALVDWTPVGAEARADPTGGC